jgi:RecJ-like exonuclease
MISEWFFESEKPSVEEHCKSCECDGEIYVCFRQNDHTGTIHIFCCECKMDDWGDCKYYCTNRCLCNCIEKGNFYNSNFEKIDNYCYTLEQARKRARQLGTNVCGVCVSALYHNNL